MAEFPAPLKVKTGAELEAMGPTQRMPCQQLCLFQVLDMETFNYLSVPLNYTKCIFNPKTMKPYK